MKRRRDRQCSFRVRVVAAVAVGLVSMDPSSSFDLRPRSLRTVRPLDFAMKNDKDTKKEPEEDDDFPEWVRGLGQWPLKPEKQTPAARSPPSSAWASLLNFEALWAMKGPAKGEEEEPEKGEPLAATLDVVQQVGGAVLNLTSLEELSAWSQWLGPSKRDESLLRAASSQLESLIADASSLVSPASVEALIVKASSILKSTNASNLVDLAMDLAGQRGLDVREATDRTNEIIDFSADLVKVADGVMRKGYVEGDTVGQPRPALPIPSVAGSRALFADFASASEIDSFSLPLSKAAEMGALAGAIYEKTVPRTHALSHTIVGQGVTADVQWMVTDSIASEPFFDTSTNDTAPVMVRTITIRGFDASDENVDRERLLNEIASAEPMSIKNVKGLVFHSGLVGFAKAIYKDVKKYIDWTAPDHMVVLNGHSVGGSLSFLLLVLLRAELGADVVREKIKRVYTFGSPPVVRLKDADKKKVRADLRRNNYSCSILETLELPCDLVEGYVQPWDPVVRLFSEIDPLYPLVEDMGPDGVTPFVGGPPRTLRPIFKRILEAWDAWPDFRDIFRNATDRSYTPVGVQNILVPEPTRYLADRFVAIDIPVPPMEALLKLSSAELLPALNVAFPLDEFSISFVPQAVRSFVHHFYPAYGFPLVEYVKRLEKKSTADLVDDKTPSPALEVGLPDVATGKVNGDKEEADMLLDWSRAAQWLQGKDVP